VFPSSRPPSGRLFLWRIAEEDKCSAVLAVGSACLVCLAASRFEAPTVSPESIPITISMPHDPHGIERQIKQQVATRPVAALTTTSNFVPSFINPFAQWAPEPQVFISPMPRASAALLWSQSTTAKLL
jgi:hypothetical protein